MNPIRIIGLAFFALSAVPIVQAQTDDRSIAIDRLGALDLAYAEVMLVDHVPGAAALAEVAHRPGAAFRVHAPRRIQQADFLVEPGQRVETGQAIVRLSGPEIEHWRLEYESVRSRFREADERYRRNQPLFESNALAESRWTEISDRWHELRLANEHMSHFAELLDGLEGSDGLLLTAPFDALVTYPATNAAPDEDELIAAFIPLDALRLHLRIPVPDRARLERVRVGSCELVVDEVGDQATGFLVDAWSEPLAGRCDLLPGQTLSAVPLYDSGSDDRSVARVPGTALLSWDQQQFVVIRDADRLRLAPIEVLTSEASDYLVRGPASLIGREVLIRSVSAVQGMLMGLGGD